MQMVLRPDDLSFCHLNSIKQSYFDIPLLLISRLDRAYIRETHIFEMACKDGRQVKVGFTNRVHAEINVFYLMFSLVFPKKISDYFAFSHSFTCDVEGWGLFNVMADLRRLGARGDEGSVRPRQHLQFVDNTQGQVCPTYPPWIALPRLLSREEIMSSANFRTKNRLPALVWLNSANGASLWRASQPKVTDSQPGITSSRCQEDEKVIQLIADSSANSALLILDARPYLNAQVNRTIGGGFEAQSKYKSTEVRFLNIPNIHVIRESFTTMLFQANSVPNSRYLSTVESSGWLEYVSTILTGVSAAVEKLDAGEAVLLHCSDGWDRTAQISSLTQMCTDSVYRTLQGFCCLIEKDWCQFGHQFAKRCGHAAPADDQQSPIFIQFLDCTVQLLRQFPTHFEFNERLLLELAQLCYSCRFGTFLCDSYQERLQQGVFEKTTSVWSYVMARRVSFTSPFYQPGYLEVIHPTVAIRRLQIWKEFFSCWGRDLYFSFSELNSQRELEEELMNYAVEREALYKSKLKEKDEEIRQLRELLQQSNRDLEPPAS
jgi:hypothetical protein